MPQNAGGWSRGAVTTVAAATARRLRQSMTPQEVKVWNWLRERINTRGWKFRRQVRIGRFVADFANMRPKVVVEIDGDSHQIGDGPRKDTARDQFLAEQGFLVIRFANSEIGRDGTGFTEILECRLADANVALGGPASP